MRTHKACEELRGERWALPLLVLDQRLGVAFHARADGVNGGIDVGKDRATAFLQDRIEESPIVQPSALRYGLASILVNEAR